MAKPTVAPAPAASAFKKADGDADPDVSDDKPEAFVPNVEFAPCVDKLPELVKASTGEEGEQELFCNRARLFRWDKGGDDKATSGEWKARGIGELKVLADEEAVKYRIVMRRDQVSDKPFAFLLTLWERTLCNYFFPSDHETLCQPLHPTGHQHETPPTARCGLHVERP